MIKARRSLCLARVMLLASGLLCRNGNALAGGGSFGCSGLDLAGGSRVGACRLASRHRRIPGIDRLKHGLGDAKRHRSVVVIASPDGERTTRSHLLQQAHADELVDDLSSGLAVDVRRL